MNIFKVLSMTERNTSRGKPPRASIVEPQVSALMRYVMDPSRQHGLRARVLELVISQIVAHQDNILWIHEENKVVDLSLDSKFQVHLELETGAEKVQESKKSRRIDILCRVSRPPEREGENPEVFYFLFEIKIDDSSTEDAQLVDEYRNFKAKPELQDGKLFLIYVAPDLPGARTAFKNLTNYLENVDGKNERSAIHIRWKGDQLEDSSTKDQSIAQIIQYLLEQDSKCEIDPIPESTKYILKCFVNFINTNFRSYEEEALRSLRRSSNSRVGDINERLKQVFDTDDRSSLINELLPSLQKRFSDADGFGWSQLVPHNVNDFKTDLSMDGVDNAVIRAVFRRGNNHDNPKNRMPNHGDKNIEAGNVNLSIIFKRNEDLTSFEDKFGLGNYKGKRMDLFSPQIWMSQNANNSTRNLEELVKRVFSLKRLIEAENQQSDHLTDEDKELLDELRQ